MALNPIVFTEKVVRSFLRYQLTAYPFADERLHAQMRRLLSLDETRQSPLLKGPYVSLSRPFRQGAPSMSLVREGVFHPHMRQRIPAEITHVYGHQEDAIRAIRAGQTTLVSTGTGSGKTECFLYPIVSKCLELRDAERRAGISAVIVYPMNALAEDQLGRLRSLLAGTGISFGMYVGKTPERESRSRRPSAARRGIARRLRGARSRRFAREAQRDRLPARGGLLARGDAHARPPAADPAHEREAARAAADAPAGCRAVRGRAARLPRLRRGAHVHGRAGRRDRVSDPSSAGVLRPRRAGHGLRRDVGDDRRTRTTRTRRASSRRDSLASPESESRPSAKRTSARCGRTVARYRRRLTRTPAALLNDCVRAVEDEAGGGGIRHAYRDLAGVDLPAGEWPEALHAALSKSELVFQLSETLAQHRGRSTSCRRSSSRRSADRSARRRF